MNRERYIDRVLDILIKDTQIDKKDLKIVYPFNQSLYALQTNFYLPLHKNFYEYCRDQYGLTLVECKELWYRYSDSINYDFSDSNNINEIYLHGSLEPSESDPRQTLHIYGFNSEGHYKFFMRVYNKIIDSIEIKRDVDGDILWINEFGRSQEGLLGLRLWMTTGEPDEDFKSFSKSFTDYIFRCCIRLMTEGLPDGGQYVSITLTDMVLKYIYENVFQNKILQRKFNLNESDERMDRFVDKVYQFLIDDTYKIGEDLIRVPFLDEPVSISYKSKRVHTVIEILMYVDEPPKPFTHYCIDTYGLDPQTINSLWVKYREFLMLNFFKLTKRY
jgi:hypothetical protein